MTTSTLVLNNDKIPICVVSATRAVNLVLNDKVSWSDDSGRVFRSQALDIAIPYVIALHPGVALEVPARTVSLRRGVMARDRYTCAYCAKFGHTIDHVVPKALGGEDSYENCVAACVGCNSLKADRTLQEMGWELSFTPRAPTAAEITLMRAPLGSVQYEKWSEYFTLGA